MLFCALLVSALALALPATPSGLLIIAWAMGTSIAFIRIGRHREGDARLWRPLGLVGFAMAGGILVRGLHGAAIGVDQPIPSYADLIHMPAYVAFNATILRVHRTRATRRDAGAWLDSLAICGALIIGLWVAGLGEFAFDETVSLLSRTLNLTYNALVVVGFAIILRISATPGNRPSAYYFLGVAAGTFVITDLAGTYALGGDSGVLISVALSPLVFGFITAALLQPSAGEVMRRHEETEQKLGLLRFGVAVMTTLSPLAILLLDVSTDRRPLRIALCMALVQATVVAARLGVLIQNQQRMRLIERQTSMEIAALARDLEHRPNDVPHLVVRALGRLGFSAVIADSRESPANAQRFEIGSGAAPVGTIDVIRPALSAHQRQAVENLVREAGAIHANSETIRVTQELQLQAAAMDIAERNERRFRALVQNSTDIVIVVDQDAVVQYVSDPVEAATGHVPDDFVGQSLEWVIHPNDFPAAAAIFASVVGGEVEQRAHEFRAFHTDGSIRLFEAVMTDMRAIPEVGGIVFNASDVTDRRRLERDLKDAETVDPTTLQLNRTAFIEAVATAQRRASVTGVRTVAVIVDLDDFKSINDDLGSDRADHVLVEVAQRIRRAVRLHDPVARLNGDEFGILLADGYSDIEALAAIERVLVEVGQPFAIDGIDVKLNATAGLVGDDDGRLDASQMLRRADTALSAAKATTPGGALVFEETMEEVISERLGLRRALDHALDNDLLRLAYQPILDAASGEIVSMEALSRWTHPDRGPVSPAVFIPIAEETGDIIRLGDWVIRSAARQIFAWEIAGFENFTVSVNMSGHQLREDDVITKVASIVEETGLDPSRLIVEITESVLIDDTDFIAQRLRDLRSLGVSLAIDDFGTGYSSLSYLQRYEFDILKIDRSFVIPLADPERIREREIVRSIISLARGLGAKTVAEGIEGEAEYEVLQELGCDRVQGFLFHQPLEVGQIPDVLARNRFYVPAA